MAIGQRVIDTIIDGSLFRVIREGDAHVIVWSANAAEQIGALVKESHPSFNDQNFHPVGEVKDQLHAFGQGMEVLLSNLVARGRLDGHEQVAAKRVCEDWRRVWERAYGR